jgi:hypothetical protein
LLVIYTPSYVYSIRNLGLAYRLAKELAPKKEIRIIIASLFLILYSKVLK